MNDKNKNFPGSISPLCLFQNNNMSQASNKRNRAYVDIAMGSISSLNKTLNFLKSNPNKLKLVQKLLYYLLDQVLLFSIFIEILIFTMV